MSIPLVRNGLFALLFMTFASRGATITVTNGFDNGTGSLRVAVSVAMNGDTIDIQVPRIDLESSEITIGSDITINGNGAMIRRITLAPFRIFDITAGTVTINNLQISNGAPSSGNGGGLRIATGATVSLSRVTISGCAAGGSDTGGGIASHGTLTMTNCTISGNSTDSGDGSGLHVSGSSSATLLNCTVAFNTTSTGLGALRNNASSITIKNSAVGRNTGGASPDVSGTFSSSGNNVVQDTTGSTGFGGSDITGVDPQLGPLADNSGGVFTHAILRGGPCLDAGNNTGAPGTDQRGIARPFGTTVDIGAYESDQNVFVVSITGGSGAGSFLQALTDSEATPAIGGKPNLVQFNVAGAGPFVISASAPAQISRDTVIDGFSQPGSVKNSASMGWNGTLQIELDVGNGSSFLVFQGNSVIQGVAVTRCAGAAIEGALNSTVVRGCFIGLDTPGTTVRANGIGIRGSGAAMTIGTVLPEDRVVIAGSTGAGVAFTSAGGSIRNCYIGTRSDGTTAAGNGGSGVSVAGTATGVTVGGTGPDQPNIIAYNGGDGVSIASGTGTSVRGNSIFSNVGLGIDLGTDGVDAVDAGDADGGANNLQNAPDFFAATMNGPNLDIRVRVRTDIPNAVYPLTVDLYEADTANQEGATYLGSVQITAGEANTLVVKNLMPLQFVFLGDNIVATVTDSANNTSEFSPKRFATNPPSALFFTTSTTLGPLNFGLRWEVSVVDDNGVIVAGVPQTVTLAFQTNPTGATLGGTLAGAVDLDIGTAVFNDISINLVGTGYQLTGTGDSISTTPGAILSLAFDIQNTIPFLAHLNPATATAGTPAFTLTLNGGGFVSNSIVTWSGQADLAPVFVNTGTLTVTVPASYIAAAGTASITVVNPAPGGGTSSIRTFTITDPGQGGGGQGGGGGANLSPVIAFIASDADPVLSGLPATLTASASDPEGAPVSFTWDFGDGSPVATGNPVSHVFSDTADRVFTVTLTVSDGALTTTATFDQDVRVANPSAVGVPNVGQDAPSGTVANPDNKITLTVAKSDGGVVELNVRIDGLVLRENEEFEAISQVSVLPGRGTVGSVGGFRPTFKFLQDGIFVVNTNVTRRADGKAGKARKQISINRREVGDARIAEAAPSSAAVTGTSLKGKFIFKDNGTPGAKPDSVTFKGTILLPAGFVITPTSTFALDLGLGNVADSVTVNAKGKAAAGVAGRVKKAAVKFPKLKKGTTALPGEAPAQVSCSLSAKDLDLAGFDTEGVNASTEIAAGSKAAARSIQVAIVLDGIAYEIIAPVQFSRTKNGDTGSIISGRGGP